MKRRKMWMILFCLVIACACAAALMLNRWQPKLPERAADGAAWDENWVTLSDALGVEAPGNGFALMDNNSILTAEDTFLASWSGGGTIPYVDEDGEESELPEAQIYLLLQGCKDAENAQKAIDEWVAREESIYGVQETYPETHGDQEYSIYVYEVTSEDNPYARGATAFAVRANYALTAELTCAEGYDGDAAAILSEFLDGFHYNAALQ